MWIGRFPVQTIRWLKLNAYAYIPSSVIYGMNLARSALLKCNDDQELVLQSHNNRLFRLNFLLIIYFQTI